MSDLLPSSLRAERGVLGIILTNNAAIYEMGDLRPEHFTAEPGHGELFRLFADQIAAGRTVTVATVVHDAQDRAILGDMRVSDVLARLEADAPDAKFAGELAAAIRDTALRARIIALTAKVPEYVQAAPVSISASKLRDELYEQVMGLYESQEDMGIRQLGDIGEAVLERLKVADAPTIGVPAGPVAVRELIGPLMPEKVYIIGGSPGSGKSSLAVQMARGVSAAGQAALVISPEMGGTEIFTRVAAAETGIRDDNIERGLIGNEEYERIWNANEAIKTERVFVDPRSAPTITMVRGQATRMRRGAGLGALFIDHLGLMGKTSPRMSDPEKWEQNLTGGKQIAKDLGIPVVFLVQFHTEALRDMAQWPHRRPSQGDIAFSGYVDQNADAILLVHRLEYFLLRHEPSAEDSYRGKPYLEQWRDRCAQAKAKAEVILAKRRSGGPGTGMRTLYFDAARYTFHDNDFRHRAAGEVPFALTGQGY